MSEITIGYDPAAPLLVRQEWHIFDGAVESYDHPDYVFTLERHPAAEVWKMNGEVLPVFLYEFLSEYFL